MKFVPRSETTRRFIIESAAEVFNKKGFAGTSITDLEKATGLTKGSIYGNFENKEAVALAVLDYNLELKFKYIREQADQRVSFKDKLLVHVLVHYPSAQSPFTPGGCPMQNTGIDAAYTNPQLKRCAASGLLKWTDMMIDTVKSGVAAHEFKASTDATSIALQIISLIEGGALYAKSTGNIPYAVKLLETAKGLIAGICN